LIDRSSDQVCSFTPLAMYSLDKALTLLDDVVAPDRLNAVQELVFRQSWLGKSYRDMARDAGYDADYLRVVGGQLWQTLSQTLGEKITKNNICAVMRHYAQSNAEHNVCTVSLTDVVLKLNEIGAPGGSVRLGSPFYIERPPVEEYGFAELIKPGALLKIKGSHLMGKTSLITRLADHVESIGYGCVRVNLQQADRTTLTHPGKFLQWFCRNLSWQLQGESKLNPFWDETLGSKVSCTRFIQRHLLESLQRPCVIAIDEVDQLFDYPETASEFFPLLRIWHEEASHCDLWQKLRLVVAYASERHPSFLSQFPLSNIGITLHLGDLTSEQLQDLASRHGLDNFLYQAKGLEYLQSLIGGHPYLACLLFYSLCQDLTNWDRLLQDPLLPNGVFGAHLQEYLATLQREPNLSQAFRMVVTTATPVQLDAVTTDRLQSLGLVKQESTGVKPYCELYRLYFCDRLPQ
jgi:hypothetical protein